jgi:hypothetical protein
VEAQRPQADFVTILERRRAKNAAAVQESAVKGFQILKKDPVLAENQLAMLLGDESQGQPAIRFGFSPESERISRHMDFADAVP